MNASEQRCERCGSVLTGTEKRGAVCNECLGAKNAVSGGFTPFCGSSYNGGVTTCTRPQGHGGFHRDENRVMWNRP